MSGWDSSGFACLFTVFCLQARSKEFALVMLSPGRSLTYRLLGPAVPCFDVFADMWHVLGFGGLIGFVKQAEASLATGRAKELAQNERMLRWAFLLAP